MGSGPDPELMEWCSSHRDDITWLAVAVERQRREGIEYDPSVELVVAHPDLPGEGPWWFMGCRAVRGDLGVRVQRRA